MFIVINYPERKNLKLFDIIFIVLNSYIGVNAFSEGLLPNKLFISIVFS